MNCQNCGIPTNSQCAGCRIAVYCSVQCQAQQWRAHRDTCKDDQLGRELERIAQVLHSAYLTFHENTWNNPIVGVSSNPQALTIFDGNQATNTRYFTAFPNNLIHDNYTKMAVLTAWCCQDPYAFLHKLTEKLLQDLNIIVEELTVDLGVVPHCISTVGSNGTVMCNWPACKHCVLLITSRRAGGRAWVIDLCGSQYGIHHVLHDWPQYCNLFVQRVSSRAPLGSAKAFIHRHGQLRGLPILAYGLVGRAVQPLDAAIDVWETQNLPLSQLRAVDDATFFQHKASLLHALSVPVQHFVSSNDFTELVRTERSFV